MKYPFGEKLRAIRELRGKTIRETAQLAGLSESLISQIERNKVSPAMDTLLSLIEVLDIDFEYLFADYRRERDVRIVRAEEHRTIDFPGIRYEQLASAGSSEIHGIEAWLLEIAPGAQRGSTEYGHVGQELGIILEGTAEFSIGTRQYQLKSGDSLSFNSDVPHVLKNPGTIPLKAYWILTPPKGKF